MSRQHFAVGERVRIHDGPGSGQHRGKSGEVVAFRIGWDEDRAIVALDELADTEMSERIFSQDELEVESARD